MDYNKTDLYCPKCGKHTVYEENDEGDFYEGPDHVCISCDTVFTIPSIHNSNDYVYSKAKMELLKEALNTNKESVK